MSHGEKADSRRGTAARAQEQPRTARLLFDAELAAGSLTPDSLQVSSVQAATCVLPVPSQLVRFVAQVRYKLGRVDFETAVVNPLTAARRAVLGKDDAPPRFLIRVDEFPHYQAWDEPGRFGTSRFERFHEIMADAGVPYLVAVLPRVSREPLSPSVSGSRPLEELEVAMLYRLSRDRVSFGLHGRDHRTRFASPRHHSELCGLGVAETEELLDDAIGELARHEIHPHVFVPPYNRFDAWQLQELARRFAVVCGGPESIGQMGLQRTPQWRGETVYLPSYAPFYGRAAEILPAVDRAIERNMGLWVPVVLHWGWEAQAGWRDLERLVARIAPHAAPWEDFYAAIERSRALGIPGRAVVDQAGMQRSTQEGDR